MPTLNDVFGTMPLTTLNDVDKMLAHADITKMDGRRSPVVMGFAVWLIRRSPLQPSFRYMETRLRSLYADTHLVAAPLREMPQGARCECFPSRRKGDYFLFFAVHGVAEARQFYAKFGITDAEHNLKRLDRTGFMIHKGTPSKPVITATPS